MIWIFIVYNNDPFLYNNQKEFAWLDYRESQVASFQDTNDSDSELIHSLSLSRDTEKLIKLSRLLGAIEIVSELNEMEGLWKEGEKGKEKRKVTMRGPGDKVDK